MTTEKLVSIIIPCYNQAEFLGEAIESALAQTYRPFEVIVVDDGSTDHTSEVVARYPNVMMVRQHNQGTSTARNNGVRASSGAFLVFLDSDDRLLPHALKVGMEHSLNHPDSGFVFGHRREIAADGTPLSTNPFVPIDKDPYCQLILNCSVYPPSLAMFRREVFESFTGFDPLIVGTEDYELYLRITKSFPIFGYEEIITEYRRHNASMTSNNARMLKSCLAVLREQRLKVQGDKELQEAYRAGIKNWRRYWGDRLVNQIWFRFKEERTWKGSIRDIMILMRYSPEAFPRQLGRKLRRVFLADRTSKATEHQVPGGACD